jgi:hypothetical protein
MREQTAKGKHLRRVTVQHESCRWLFYIRFFINFYVCSLFIVKINVSTAALRPINPAPPKKAQLGGVVRCSAHSKLDVVEQTTRPATKSRDTFVSALYSARVRTMVACEPAARSSGSYLKRLPPPLNLYKFTVLYLCTVFPGGMMEHLVGSTTRRTGKRSNGCAGTLAMSRSPAPSRKLRISLRGVIPPV